MITLNYTITEQEYKDFYYFLGWTAPHKKKDRIKYQVTSILSYLAIFVVGYYLTKPFPLGIPAFVILIICGIGLYYYNNFRLKRHFYKYGIKVYNDSDKENSEMIIGESGILGKSTDSEVHYKWSAFTNKYETGSAYYLIMSSGIGLVIPKRVFNSSAEKVSFEKMLSQYLPLQADLPGIGK
jgi:YcxB-like protein